MFLVRTLIQRGRGNSLAASTAPGCLLSCALDDTSFVMFSPAWYGDSTWHVNVAGITHSFPLPFECLFRL